MKYIVNEMGKSTWQIVEGEGQSAVYSYLLEGEKEAVLIDTGYGTINLKRIVEKITTLPVRVFLTHGHVDHIGGTKAFENVYMNLADQTLYENHSKGEIRDFFLGEENAFEIKDVKEVYDFTHVIDEQGWYDIGDRPLQIICTPGHSQGCVCIWDMKNRWLFTGDMCCKADVLLNMENSTDICTYAESIKKILLMDFVITWPGHHECPVDRGTVEEFLEASQNIISKRAKGELLISPTGDAYRYAYKDIAILYPIK